MAVLFAVEHWRPYLQLGEFVIRTDQRSLVHLEEQRLTTVWQHKAFTKLLGLQYRIVYKRGEDNRAADALSRRPAQAGKAVCTLSECRPSWLKDVVAGYQQVPETQCLLAELAVKSPSGPFSLHQGVIKYKHRVWLGGNPAVQQQVLQALHDAPVGGHSGYPVTYAKLNQHFAWPRMRADVQAYVRSC
jgi:hypothetical protein